ncbi:MAG: hypothetical protein CMH62_00500 [Nanoarchaeota archaeon]|jgi:hypothetical protein|nr:hypothetical protein [Nanoarchaeota archaeon]|tara:strand:- start:564 stop:2366 length:1803 start_codon:yes stop_codon:yes gene_type:complete
MEEEDELYQNLFSRGDPNAGDTYPQQRTGLGKVSAQIGNIFRPSSRDVNISTKEVPYPSMDDWGRSENELPLQYNWDKYGAPKYKKNIFGTETWKAPIVRQENQKGDLTNRAYQEKVKWNPNPWGGVLKTKTTPFEPTKKRLWTENWDSDQWNKRNKYSRLAQKGFGEDGQKGYRKRLDPTTEPYRLHIPVKGEVPDALTRLMSPLTAGMNLATGTNPGFNYNPLRSTFLGSTNFMGMKMPNYSDMDLGQKAAIMGIHPQTMFGITSPYSLSPFAHITPGEGTDPVREMKALDMIPWFGGGIAGSLNMMKVPGTQKILNQPYGFNSKFRRNYPGITKAWENFATSPVVNTILPQFERWSQKGEEITTDPTAGFFGRQAGWNFGGGKGYYNQAKSKIHPLIPFTGEYTIGGDYKGGYENPYNPIDGPLATLKNLGHRLISPDYYTKGGLDRDLRMVGGLGASYETPIPLLPPRHNIFDVNRFDVERTREEIYDPNKGGRKWKWPRIRGASKVGDKQTSAWVDVGGQSVQVPFEDRFKYSAVPGQEHSDPFKVRSMYPGRNKLDYYGNPRPTIPKDYIDNRSYYENQYSNWRQNIYDQSLDQ